MTSVVSKVKLQMQISNEARLIADKRKWHLAAVWKTKTDISEIVCHIEVGLAPKEVACRKLYEDDDCLLKDRKILETQFADRKKGVVETLIFLKV